ncbi:RluA family pseudouridine synthase [Bacillus aquiflavi]|uniref:Pseudouridine synthase n=1 Tax=Bacillus aquiflavi TaxID=2672567 RepID=A0A6B3VNW2_9BACI|nr:RluA family pseudouridine synthase [Bacillus aquiflavi]MBA4535604.1 RluA family pseudouridine synthase [Bacillus aquiflavi]NEY79980.1 RluA family pseudouridine synthase [Bacillus aquiflavi]UAC48921.1 RluA family pseudouridine synthase [Bacillus aquiflavi]
MIVTFKKGELFEIIIPSEWSGITIEHLFKVIFQAPKKLTHQFRMNKLVTINGKITNWHTPLQEGNRLQIRLFQEEPCSFIPAYHDIEVLYEDDHLLILNKPAGMDTHPNELKQTNTLANAAAYYLQAKGELRNVRHVHRLDRNTSGAILFAKHTFSGALLDKLLEEQKITRTYVALVHGMMQQKRGTINNPIGRDRHHPTRRRVSRTGQAAITKYKVIETYADKEMTLIQCELLTGRTHQIRVHLSHIGHPLAGDQLYGGKNIFPRQALHSLKLTFLHPFTKEEVICHAPFLDKHIFPQFDLYQI